MPPLALTDSQLDTVYRAAGPLAPAVRPAFLELVAQSLADAGEIGWGGGAALRRGAAAFLGAAGSVARGRLEQVKR
jgi:hypothetical protein